MNEQLFKQLTQAKPASRHMMTMNTQSKNQALIKIAQALKEHV